MIGSLNSVSAGDLQQAAKYAPGEAILCDLASQIHTMCGPIVHQAGTAQLSDGGRTPTQGQSSQRVRAPLATVMSAALSMVLGDAKALASRVRDAVFKPAGAVQAPFVFNENMTESDKQLIPASVLKLKDGTYRCTPILRACTFGQAPLHSLSWAELAIVSHCAQKRPGGDSALYKPIQANGAHALDA